MSRMRASSPPPPYSHEMGVNVDEPPPGYFSKYNNDYLCCWETLHVGAAALLIATSMSILFVIEMICAFADTSLERYAWFVLLIPCFSTVILIFGGVLRKNHHCFVPARYIFLAMVAAGVYRSIRISCVLSDIIEFPKIGPFPTDEAIKEGPLLWIVLTLLQVIVASWFYKILTKSYRYYKDRKAYLKSTIHVDNNSDEDEE